MRIARLVVAAALVAACTSIAPVASPTVAPQPTAPPTPTPIIIYVTPAPTPSPEPTAPPTPDVTSAPTDTPTLPPTPAPTPTAPPATVTPEPTPTRAPEPTPFAQQPGVIYFGRDYDPDTLYIVDPATSFRRGQKIAWSAVLSEGAGATTLTVTLSKVIGEGGAERVQYTEEVTISSPDNDVLANKVNLSLLVRGKGLFTMRYFREATLLAEGTFELT